MYIISIGAATSRDGVEWRRVGDVPVITDPEFIHDFGDPHVIYDRGRFKMWFGDFSGIRAIYSAESENCLDWSEPVPALFPDANQ